ncbi:T9SS type A sorting domain-containing protein [uncultured Aquimarina sp.]|uniref:T9SS type A sorting domain-containing protein n=1 Tax=uncultured Aquimarina sp. TaxID=575652 RepID=UPI002605D60F|nr:T9SS type A sorting domain-containing protein [uncultured Aquimarina sp.]
MKTISTFLMVWIVMATQAQSIDTSVISNSGSTNSNTSHIITFTIGETFIETITNSESIDQGFWSGIASLNVLSTEEFLFNNSTVTIYPNPVSDFFTIRIPDVNSYTISLFNLNGQEIMTKKLNTSLLGNRIDISTLPYGTYILRLSIPENNENKIFKIIKK